VEKGTKSKLEHALWLAGRGFRVFPLVINGKTPLIKDFKNRATNNPDRIKSFWTDPVMGVEQNYNIGVPTDDLIVVDIDYRKGATTDGFSFPKTVTQQTPNGEHWIYSCPGGVKQGADVLKRGIDIRSYGGYIAACGSTIGDKTYKMTWTTMSPAPPWLIDKCGPSKSQRERRVIFYLEQEAPLAVEGSGGDQTTFAVAAKCKDFGVSMYKCHRLMLDHWNEDCSPPWDPDELYTKVENAYHYGSNPPGILDPKNEFTKAIHNSDPSIAQFNKDHAFIIVGNGHYVLWETKNSQGNFELKLLSEATFHRLYASLVTLTEKKAVPLTKMWMNDEDRRSYDGIIFAPGKENTKRYYNLWHGFTIEPSKIGTEQAVAALNAFFEHVTENICYGEDELANWLLGYFAHMIQKPGEKPNVAIVLKGDRGVGKNAFVDRIGHLLGNHYMTVSDKRYLLGNFNSHLQNKLMFVLDEAFWSGDKQAHGILKALITSEDHIIELKGKEPYSVKNLLRICILGNEDWLVPAAFDERRYAVFDVGNGKKQDKKFFIDMREGMEAGGYGLLLRHLLEFDLSTVDIGAAPATKGLLEQKETSLGVLEEWWFKSLTDGRIKGIDFIMDWPEQIDTEVFREAYYTYHKRKSKSYLPGDRVFGKKLKLVCPIAKTKRTDGKNRTNIYKLPTLENARLFWEEKIGHKIEWEDV